ncbi:SRPBCC domain-containing protein [Thalassolituus sp. LLYu03]|uniref:SRPBCC domain-containing protein n=1 Tax=Thalassolituus sp. LLYu03 TaxID=3421656 RepID=UPI003D27CDC4
MNSVSARTLSTQRELPFTAADVFAAFAVPERLAQWWGPAGFTNTFDVFEFRTGGRWVFTMHAPDGQSYANDSRFVALVEGEQVVVEHLCAPHFVLTIGLSASDKGTLIRWDQVFDDEQTAAAVRAYAGEANEQNLDRLHAVLNAV